MAETLTKGFHVVIRNGWSFVVDEAGCDFGEWSGPWRYRWEAQDYADELNGAPGQSSAEQK